MAHIIRSQIIHKHSGRYVAWPMVARAANGELLLVFSGDREGHVCPYGKTFLMRSDTMVRTGHSPNLSTTRRWTIATPGCAYVRMAR